MYPEMYEYQAQKIRDDFRRANAGRHRTPAMSRIRSLIHRATDRGL